MKINYQLELDRLIAGLDQRPSLLLHSCCGPCSSYVIEYLRQYFDLTVFYYNPNIQPQDEYEKRLNTQKQLLAAMCPEIPLLELGWDGPCFVHAAAGLEQEPEGGRRCSACFALRLDRTVREAAARHFDYFATTLTVSPHKDAQRINGIGLALAEKYGVAWLPSDFKKREGYKRSIQLSAQYELYRQNYCGCIYSCPPRAE